MSHRLEDLLPANVHCHFLGKAVGEAVKVLVEKHGQKYDMRDTVITILLQSTVNAGSRIIVEFPVMLNAIRIFHEALKNEGLQGVINTTTDYAMKVIGISGGLHILRLHDLSFGDFDVESFKHGFSMVDIGTGVRCEVRTGAL